MSFPTSPTNGDTTTVNGITYTYRSATRSWLRTQAPLGNINVSGNLTAGNLSITNTGDVSANIGNLFLGNTTTQANLGSYQSYANLTLNNILSNLGAFETYANTKIGTNTDSNLVVDATTTSTSTITGALVTKGGAGIAGNAYIGGNIVVTSNISANKFFTTNGLYWAGNGTAFGGGTGITYTAGTSPPISGNVKGDQWYNTVTDVLFEYLDNGVSQYWVDIQTSVIAANAVVTIPELIQANLGAYQLYANANIGTLFLGNASTNANIGTLFLGNASTNANLGAYQLYANANIGTLFLGNASTNANIGTLFLGNASTNANLGAYQTYANSKIGTNTNSNLVVDATTISTSTTTGAIVVKGGAGIAGNTYIGANLVVTQSGVFQGPYNESSILSGVFVGNTGTGGGITPRVGFFNGNTQQNWQIDNNLGEFRWFVPGSVKLSLYPNGNLNVTGSLTVGGKKAVNGPAFSAYANSSAQTITSGSQQKVLFQVEEFDTDNCYSSSRFTPNVEGYYQLNAEVRLDGASGTGEMMIVLYRNGSEYKRGWNQQGTQIAANFWAMTISSLAYADGIDDYFEIYVQQGSGSSVTVTAVNAQAITWFNGAMVRGA